MCLTLPFYVWDVFTWVNEWRCEESKDYSRDGWLYYKNSLGAKIGMRWKYAILLHLRGLFDGNKGNASFIDKKDVLFMLQKEPLEAILRRCPLIRKLAIHDEHILRDIDPKLLEQMTNIDELHIPSGLFGRFQSFKYLHRSCTISFPLHNECI